MGGRGSSSGLIGSGTGGRFGSMQYASPQPIVPPQPQPMPIQTQPPSDDNTPVLSGAVPDLSTWSDDALAQAVIDSRTIQMPNMLSDVDDATQRFIYTIGANEKPLVLDDNAFDQFMADNNIGQSEILSRSVDDITYTNNDGTAIKMTADRVSRLLKYSRLNYIGGKYGGQLYGAGTYFAMNGGGNTGYGNTTINAVLNPATARVITDTQLRAAIPAFEQSHPKFAQATGGLRGSGFFTGGGNDNLSIYAMAMGYNVIKSSHNNYHNVIDRRAIVYRRDDR